MNRKFAAIAAPALLAVTTASLADGGPRPTILLTGYWPPTNEMVRPFSTNPKLNPDGWIGENWEGRGYDIHSFFPEFDPPNCSSCGRGMGDLEVDYQDTSADFWPIADGVAPYAVITFSRGSSGMTWELEMNQFNRNSWVNDYDAPLQPTPSPPDDSVPVGYLRPSQLPVEFIVDAVNDSGLGLDAFVCYTGDGGGFLSEFIAYHGVWYQDIHADPGDPVFCAAAGHVHVGTQVSWPTAHEATKVTLRTLIDYLEQIELVFFFPDGQPMFIAPFGGQRIRVEVTGRTKDPAAGTGMLHFSTDGVVFTAIPMEEIEPNVYDAVFPAFDCGARVYYYFSAEGTGGEVVYNPPGIPESTYGADAYNAEVRTFEDDFETDTGWDVVNTGGLTDGGWERGTPAGGPLAPASDADGSGQCYVTGLGVGQDVDGTETILTSPIMDASDPEAVLAFDQWFATVTNGGLSIMDVSGDGGDTWVLNTEILRVADAEEAWRHREFIVADLPVGNTPTLRVRFKVRDVQGENNTVEAGIDAVRVRTGFTCVNPCVEDVTGDGVVDFQDILRILGAWGPCEGCPEDIDNSGGVAFGDLLAVLGAWGPC